MSDRWISAYTTRKRVAERRDAHTAEAVDKVEFAIVDYARTVLPARCQFMWDKTLHDDGHVDTTELLSAEVPSWVWSLTDEMRLDWATGIFHLAGDREGQTRYIKLQGVEFAADSVDRIWPMAAGAETSLRAIDPVEALDELLPKTRKAKPRKPEWNDWTAALTLLALDGDVNGSMTDSELMRLINDRLATWSIEEMPRSTVQATVSVVLDRLRSTGL